MLRRNRPLQRAARFFQSEMAGTHVEYALILASIIVLSLITVAYLGRDVNRSFHGASRELVGGTSHSKPNATRDASSHDQNEPVAVVNEPSTYGASGQFVLMVSLLAVGVALICCKWFWRQSGRRTEKDDDEQSESPGEHYIYRRRQKILQKFFNNTAVLFKCRLQVRDLMSDDFEAVPPHTKVADLAVKMKENRLQHVFVCSDEGRLLGIVQQQDLGDRSLGRAKDIMDRTPLTVRPDVPLTRAISMILNQDRWTLPVVEDGCLCGEITRTDLAISLQCVFQIFMRIGQFAHSGAQDDRDLASSIRTALTTQRAKLNGLTHLVRKREKNDPQRAWRTICEDAEDLLLMTKHLTQQVEKAADELDQRMQNLMTLFEPRIDALTGLCNRSGLEDTLRSMCAMNRRYKQSVSFMLTQFVADEKPDHDSSIPADEERLRRWGKWLDENVRETDLVARYDDETFGIVLPHTDQEAASQCRSRLETEFSRSEFGSIGTSMIVAVATASESDGAVDLMKRANTAFDAEESAIFGASVA